MAASLHVTPLSLKAVVASYILSLAVCIPVGGWIADRYGTRRVFAVAGRSRFATVTLDWLLRQHYWLGAGWTLYRGGTQDYDQIYINLGYRF